MNMQDLGRRANILLFCIDRAIRELFKEVQRHAPWEIKLKVMQFGAF